MTMNKILIIGNLGSDPEMRYTPNGNAVTSFSVATNRRYTTGGETREETEWFRVSAWNRLAETCNQYLTKGSKVYVDGRLTSRSFQGNDGQMRFSLEVNATDVRFIDSRSSTGTDANDSGNSNFGDSPVTDQVEELDDLPW